MGIKKSAYFLVHRDTGQRYPINGPVIIGRTRGDIVFSSDTKLSIQHCMVEPQGRGLNVRDLRSASGTRINGKPISPDRDHFLRPRDELSLGEQAFTLQSVTRSKRIKRRHKSKNGEGLSLLLLAIAAIVVYFAWQSRVDEKLSANSPVQTQLGEIFESYQALQMSFERQTAPPNAVADRIQEKVLGPLSAMSRRWTAISGDSKSNRVQAIQVRFAAALANHAKAQVAYIRSGDSKYSDEADQWADQMERAIGELRLIPGQQFPALVYSPLQIVERELREALRDYRALGTAVQSDLNDKVMSEKIRSALLPKFAAVYARLGAISAQNEFEKRKVDLQRKLVNAVIEQLKAMSLYSVSKDTKYAREMELWGNEIRRANESLKQETHPIRAPSSAAGAKR